MACAESKSCSEGNKLVFGTLMLCCFLLLGFFSSNHNFLKGSLWDVIFWTWFWPKSLILSKSVKIFFAELTVKLL